MRKLLLTATCCSSLLSSEITQSHIDTTVSGIALGSFLELHIAEHWAAKFQSNDIYIKHATEHGKKYFVLYALNINPDTRFKDLQKIQKITPSAYIISDYRLKELAKPKAIEIQHEAKVDYIDNTKKAVTVTFIDSREKALLIASTLNDFTVYIELAKMIDSSLYIIHVVNIPTEQYNLYLKDIQWLYPDAFEIEQNQIIDFSNKLKINNSFLFHTLNLNSKDIIDEDTRIPIVSIAENSANNKYLQAKNLFKNKKYYESIKILENLLEDNTKNVGINFYLGRAYYMTKNYEQSVAAFDRVDILTKNNLRAKVELGQSYLMLGMNTDAISTFTDVLGHDIPNSVRTNINNRLSYIKNKEQKIFYSGMISASFSSDNNINNTTDIQTFDTPAYDNLEVEDKQYRDITTTVLYNGSLVYKIDDDTSFATGLTFVNQEFDKDDQRNSDSNGTGIEKESEKHLSLFTYNAKLIHSNKFFQGTMGLDTTKITLSGDDFLAINGFNITAQTKTYSGISFTTGIKAFNKDYKKEENKNLNSKNHQFFIGQSISTDKYGKFNFSFVNLNEFRSDKKIHDKKTNTVSLFNKYNLTKDFSMNSAYSHTQQKEQGKDSVFQINRNDKSNSVSLGLDYKINNNFDIFIDVKAIENNSNIPIYTYDKEIMTIGSKVNF